jgi:uncharacterized membrane protein YphA (DoxX/SURF4 family)
MNMKCGLSCVCNCKNAKDWALLALRLVLGVIFVFHGYGKLWGAPGIEAFTGMIDKIGFPAPALFAYLAALTEFIGGLALLAGIGTTVASGLLVIVMLVAILAVHGIKCPGRYSVAAMMCKGCEDGGRCCNKDDAKMTSGKK